MSAQTIIHRHNDGNGGLSFELRQDCTPIMELAKRQQSEGLTGSNDMKLAARLPEVIVTKYLNDHQITLHEFISNPEHVKRLCNSPELEYFRVWRGKI